MISHLAKESYYHTIHLDVASWFTHIRMRIGH